jgi:hypothetical protein
LGRPEAPVSAVLRIFKALVKAGGGSWWCNCASWQSPFSWAVGEEGVDDVAQWLIASFNNDFCDAPTASWNGCVSAVVPVVKGVVVGSKRGTKKVCKQRGGD